MQPNGDQSLRNDILVKRPAILMRSNSRLACSLNEIACEEAFGFFYLVYT
jgi:hypothetical protein